MKSLNLIYNPCWLAISLPSSHFPFYILTSHVIILAVYFFISGIFHLIISSSVTFFPLSLQPCWKSKVYLTRDWQSLCVSSEVLSVSFGLCLTIPVSVLAAYQARQCAPLTWSSWLPCLMEGLRSRNHQSLFGRLFQRSSSQSQGADGTIHFTHLCADCYQRAWDDDGVLKHEAESEFLAGAMQQTFFAFSGQMLLSVIYMFMRERFIIFKECRKILMQIKSKGIFGDQVCYWK